MLSSLIRIFTIQFVQMGLYKIEYPHVTSFASATHKEPASLCGVSLVYVWEFPSVVSFVLINQAVNLATVWYAKCSFSPALPLAVYSAPWVG